MSTRTNLGKIAIVMSTGLFLLLLPNTGSAACRMYAAIGAELPNGMLYNHLRGDTVNFPNALYYLSPVNDDGWGIADYLDFGDLPSIARGEPMAQSDPAFTAAVNEVNDSEPQVVMAHIRKGTSGCWNVPDPHPFYRDKIGKRWLFEHNGGVDKFFMETLLEDYLSDNPPNGSDIPECASGVVDSELYFLFVLKNIEENGWNAVSGISEAIRAMEAAGDTYSAINFIMSDGNTVWAFRRGGASYSLYYLYDSANGYSVAASQYPSSSQGSWVLINNYQLVVLRQSGAPVVIDDVRTYCPGDINKDETANAADLEEFAEYFGRSGNGDLDFDGEVDGSDLASLIAVYDKACP